MLTCWAENISLLDRKYLSWNFRVVWGWITREQNIKSALIWNLGDQSGKLLLFVLLFVRKINNNFNAYPGWKNFICSIMTIQNCAFLCVENADYSITVYHYNGYLSILWGSHECTLCRINKIMNGEWWRIDPVVSHKNVENKKSLHVFKVW